MNTPSLDNLILALRQGHGVTCAQVATVIAALEYAASKGSKDPEFQEQYGAWVVRTLKELFAEEVL